MKKTRGVLLVALVLALGAYIGLSPDAELQADDPGIDGTWTVVSMKDADGKTHTPPSNARSTYTFDTTAETMTVKIYEDDNLVESFAVDFTINEEGNLRFTDESDLELVMSFSVDGSELTLGYLSHEGQEGDPPNLPYLDGQPPVTATLIPGPPQELKMTK